MDDERIVLIACNAKTAEQFPEVPKEVFVITDLINDDEAAIIGKDEFMELVKRGETFRKDDQNG